MIHLLLLLLRPPQSTDTKIDDKNIPKELRLLAGI